MKRKTHAHMRNPLRNMAPRRSRRIMKLNLNMIEQETWSDLPKDLLLSILSRLTLQEQTCSSVVCKSWFSIAISERVSNKPPLLLKFPKSGDIYEIYNPTTGERDYTELPQLSGCRISGNSMDGWLLVYNETIKRAKFFNPYTKVSVTLPHSNLFDYQRFTFSSSPVSNDCTVFALRTISPTTVAIGTCYIKTMKWITSCYGMSKPPLDDDWQDIIFSNGHLYCISINGWLRIFDTRIRKWTLNVVPPPNFPLLPVKDRYREGYITTLSERIFFVYMCCCVKEPIIFRLDQANGKWEEMKTLGGVIFFVSTWSAQARVDVLGMKANNIYFPEVRFYGQQCIRYSVNEGRFYPNKRYSLANKEYPLSIWIDPPASLS